MVYSSIINSFCLGYSSHLVFEVPGLSRTSVSPQHIFLSAVCEFDAVSDKPICDFQGRGRIFFSGPEQSMGVLHEGVQWHNVNIGLMNLPHQAL